MTLISRAFTVIAFAGSFGRFSSVQNTVHIQFFLGNFGEFSCIIEAQSILNGSDVY